MLATDPIEIANSAEYSDVHPIADGSSPVEAKLDLELSRALVLKDESLDCAQAVSMPTETTSFEVVSAPTAYSVLVARIESMQPDCVVLMLPEMNQTWLDWLAQLHSKKPVAVVVWLQFQTPEIHEKLSDAGVCGVLLGHSAAKNIESTIAFAQAQHRKVMQLEKALKNTQIRLEGRQWVEKAKGLIMQQHGISEHEAYSQLRSSAMQQGITLGELSKRVINVFEEYA